MIISGFQKLSLLDYPKQPCAVLFTQGCNFKCPYCHNSDLIPNQGDSGFSEDSLLSYLKKRQPVLKAVCITGGEPTIHKSLPGFLSKIKTLNYQIKLDTNGSHPEMLEELIQQQLLDFIAMDIKAPFQKYHLLAGVKWPVSEIKKSIKIISQSGLSHLFRTTVDTFYLNEIEIKLIKDMLPARSEHIVQEAV